MTGVKTGWTPSAGYCFSGCMEKDGLVFYSVILGGEELPYDENRIIQGDFLDTIELYGLADSLTAAGPAQEPQNAEVTSLLGAGKFEVAVPESARLLIEDGQTVTATYDIPKVVFGPVEKGDPVGAVTLASGEVERTFDLVAVSSCSISPLVVAGAVAVVAVLAAIAVKAARRR